MSDLAPVRKRYGLRTVNVATWRDPEESTLPARGGPLSPTIAADDVSRVYAPVTYKVKYKLAPRTNNEESESENDDDDSGEEEPLGTEGRLFDLRKLWLN